MKIPFKMCSLDWGGWGNSKFLLWILLWESHSWSQKKENEANCVYTLWYVYVCVSFHRFYHSFSVLFELICFEKYSITMTMTMAMKQKRKKDWSKSTENRMIFFICRSFETWLVTQNKKKIDYTSDEKHNAEY